MKDITDLSKIKVKSDSGKIFTAQFKRALHLSSAGLCQYCGVVIFNHREMHVDHIIPKSLGGTDDLSNLRCSCSMCNTIKKDGDLERLRWLITFRKSKYSGIISPKQARILIDMGENLDIPEPIKFHFEVRNAVV